MLSLSKINLNDTPPDTTSDTTLFYGILAQYTISKLFHGPYCIEFTVDMSVSSMDYEVRNLQTTHISVHYFAQAMLLYNEQGSSVLQKPHFDPPPESVPPHEVRCL